MKVTVFGAVTGTGQEVVRQLLTAGHDVTAFARPALAPVLEEGQVRMVRAEPGDRPAIRTAVLGADAVICAVGCNDNTPGPVTTGLRVVLDVMAESGVHRLVAVSSALAAPSHQKTLSEHLVMHPILSRLFGDRFADMRRMEAMLVGSESAWTVFRAPWKLTDGPATGRYRTSHDTKLRRANKLSRADLAHALIAALTDNDLVGHFVTISY